MSYLVLARKWRPQQLDDLAGQSHVSVTLGNALRTGRIAHAFLFTGARGVGKTSAARILAKALCCQAGEGPTPTPCGACSMCLEIADGRATDVFEIDAASNTGVANVREIIENVRYLPSKARFKIYIIDEVHMLSTGAFNALLKTLEEPPAHVKFILATTDAHKVPVTILSRCQRYDFRRLPVELIRSRLSAILSEEKIEHDPSALTLVAKAAEGSMRDAQSLLEQVLTYAGGRRIDAELVRSSLGTADRAATAEVIAAILSHNPRAIVERVKEVYERGGELGRFADALVEHVRDLLMARILPDPTAVIDLPRDEIERLITEAKGLDSVALERLFGELAKLVEGLAESPYPRFALEVGLVALSETPDRIPIATLVEKLDGLEQRLADPKNRPSAAPGGAARTFRETEALRGPPRPPKAEPPPKFEPRSEPPPKFEPPPRVEPKFEPPPRVEPKSEPPRVEPKSEPPKAVEPRIEPAKVGKLPVYKDFVDLVRKKRPTLSGSLVQVRPLAFSPERVEIGCESRFDEGALGSPDNKRILEDLLAELFGAAPILIVRRVEREALKALPKTLSELDEAKRAADREQKVAEAKQSPAVRRIEDILGAEVARVRIHEES